MGVVDRRNDERHAECTEFASVSGHQADASMSAPLVNFTEARVAVARRSLERARAHLDDAMGTLPDRAGDNTMATPALLALLLNAVAARHHLADIEAVLADEIEATAQQLTLVARSRDPWP
jgi:hypothetical protein